MAANLNAQPAHCSPMVEVTSDTLTLPLLRLLGTDMNAVASELPAKVDQAPQLFCNKPVIIDLGALQKADDVSVGLPLLVGLLRGCDMVPVGVRGGTEAQNEVARAMDLAILSAGSAKEWPTEQSIPKGSHQPVKAAATKTITAPVRSGQRVYARGGALVVLSHVSSGAEVMADGDIHIYGALRGRAFAGVKGNRSARIFCQALHAELIAISGRCRLNENLNADLQGKPAHIYLQDRTLKIKAL